MTRLDTSYVASLRLLRDRPRWFGTALGIAAAVAYPLIADGSWIRFGTIVGITVIAVSGLQILTGLVGLISVGQSAFMGIGAYMSAVAASTWALPFPIPLVAGAVGAAVIGLLVGLPAARLSGFYLALTTLALQYVFTFTAPRLPESWLGGSQGLGLAPPTIAGHSITSSAEFYYLVLPFALAAVTITACLRFSRAGRAWVAIRDGEIAARVTGINVTALKIKAFGLAAALAGVAGGLLAYENGIAFYEQFTLIDSIWYLAMLIVGGGGVLGVVIGVAAVQFISEAMVVWSGDLQRLLPGDISLALLAPLADVAIGVTLILVLVFRPDGLNSWLLARTHRLRRWPLRA